MPKQINQTIHTLTDAATVNSAIGLLGAGSHRCTCTWDLASLRRFTYSLLLGRVHVLPAMGPRMKPVGRYQQIVQELPELGGLCISTQTRNRITGITMAATTSTTPAEMLERCNRN